MPIIFASGEKCPCDKCKADPNAPGLDFAFKAKLGMVDMGILSYAAMHNIPFPTVRVTSARRCVDHNAAVGGAPDSQHIFGLAVDLATDGDSKKARAIVQGACYADIPGVEVCESHIHLDGRDGPHLLLWGKNG